MVIELWHFNKVLLGTKKKKVARRMRRERNADGLF